jgi:hypothetical protein
MHRPLLLILLAVQPLRAQTVDWARISVGVSLGIQAGSSLWDVPDQPILSSNQINARPYPPDLYQLRREIRSGFTLAAQVTHFSSPRFGITAEFTYLGLKLSDMCHVARDGGDPELATACAYVGSSQAFAGSTVDQSASTTLVQAGVVLRPFKPGTLQPFIKAMAGFAETPRSTLEMESIYGALADTAIDLTIYKNFGWSQTRPIVTAAVGLSTAPNSGLQVHFEVRETFLTQSIVTGPATTQNQEPPNHSVVKGIPSVLIGLELVLKRERGKRY